MVKAQSKTIKDTFIKVRVSADEKAKINELARSCTQSQSEYARARLLGYKADNTKKEKLILNAQITSNINLIARQVVKYQSNIDKLILLEALNTLAEKMNE